MALRSGEPSWRNLLAATRSLGPFILSFVAALSSACQLGPTAQPGAGLVPPRIERFQQLPFEGWVSTLAFSHKGHTLVVGGCQGPEAAGSDLSGGDTCTQGVVQVWNLERSQSEATRTLPRAVTALAVSPDGSRWVAGDSDGRLILSTSPLKGIPKPFYQKSEITALAFSPDRKWVVSGSLDPLFPLGFMDMMTGGVVKVNTKFEPVTALAFSSDGKSLAVGMAKGKLVVWDFASSSSPVQVTPNRGEGYAITSVTFSSDGRLLAYGRRNGKVVVFDRSSAHSLVEFKGSSAINALAFSPDDRYLALGQDNGKVVLVQSERAQEIWSKRHILPISDLAYSPDGASLAVASQHSVYLYRISGMRSEQPSTLLGKRQEETTIAPKTASPTVVAPEPSFSIAPSGNVADNPQASQRQ